jgi:hypothetical protein
MPIPREPLDRSMAIGRSARHAPATSASALLAPSKAFGDDALAGRRRVDARDLDRPGERLGGGLNRPRRLPV